jgi:hypothetical protein
MMDCAVVSARLDDFVDGELPAVEREALAAHVATCERCRAELDGLRKLLAAAGALPREGAPERDLWPSVVERLVARRGSAPAKLLRPLTLLPLAATLILAVTVAFSIQQRRRRDLSQHPDVRIEPAALVWPSDTVDRAAAEYEEAARQLSLAVERERQSLPPGAAETVARNIKVIDGALDELREALRKEPGNPLLARLLVATHRQKVDVLSRAHRLSTPL